MSDIEVMQRVKYLVEHGGLYEDPHEDIRRKVTSNRILAGIALVLVVVDLIFELTRL